MNTKSISKEVLINYLQCPKRAWIASYGQSDMSRSIASDALLEQGMQVHSVARTVFDDAKKIASGALTETAVKETNNFISGSDGVLFNSEFLSGNVSARIDVLEKTGENFKIIDIRSGSSVKDVYLNDCAIQYVCATDNGINVESVEIMHPNTKIAKINNSNGSEVFVKKDVTIEVKDLASKVVHWIKDCTSSLSGDIPMCSFGEQCKIPNECPYLTLCKPVILEEKSVDSVEYLPSKTGLVKELIASGVSKISDLPVIALKNKRNSLVYDAIVQNAGVVSENVQSQLKDLPYPQFFIDFETCAFPIPRFSGMRSYQPLTFQWSCHTKQGVDISLVHSEFMDVTGSDPRQNFLKSLIQTVGDTGPIFVFSSYEKLRLEELADDLPSFKDAIDKIVARIVDMLPLARSGYYHPDMRGSWSLKRIVPTLPMCDGLVAYSDMDEISDGMAAQAAYMQQINDKIIGSQKAVQMQKMLKYCESDTLGLAHFVECLKNANVCPSSTRGEIFIM